MRDFALDGRLLSVGSFVRQGAQFADIGTDHAYLPIYLLRTGRIGRAVAADINDGPLKSAMENARATGLFDNIKFFLTDGLTGLDGEELSDIAIAGMGGELIADILGRAPFVKSESVRLILQPMSRQAHLRRYLAAEGFRTVGEAYSYSAGKYYLTICAEYSGEKRELDLFEAELGRRECLKELTPEALGYLKQKRKAYAKIARGRILGGEEQPWELLLCNYIDELIGE